MHRLPFVKPSDAEWIELIRSEVASGRLEDALWWSSPEGWRVRAFYQRMDTPADLSPVLSRPGGTPWDMRIPVAWTGAWPTAEAGVSHVALWEVERAAFDERPLIARHGATGRSDLRLVPGPRHREVRDGLSASAAAALLSVEHDPSRNLEFPGCSAFRAETLAAWDRLDRRIRWFFSDAVDLPGSPTAGPATALAFAFASASAWISAGLDAGVAPRDLAPGLLVALPTHRSYFATVAAFRAARIGIARLFEAYGGSAADSSGAAVHGFISTASLEPGEGDTNLVRATIQLAAAVVGGCDAVQILPPPGNPSGRNERLYANLHHLLREEGHLHEVADPSAGAGYVEQLTRAIGEAAWAAFARVEPRFDAMDPRARSAAVLRAVLESAPEDRP